MLALEQDGVDQHPGPTNLYGDASDLKFRDKTEGPLKLKFADGI